MTDKNDFMEHREISNKMYGVGWKYHNFLVVILVIGAILNLATSLMHFSGYIYVSDGLDPKQIYLNFPELKIVDVVYGVTIICFSLFQLYVRKQLELKTEKAPRLIVFLHLISVIPGVIYNYIVGNIVNDLGSVVPTIIASILVGMLYSYITYVYYSKRKFAFGNLPAGMMPMHQKFNETSCVNSIKINDSGKNVAIPKKKKRANDIVCVLILILLLILSIIEADRYSQYSDYFESIFLTGMLLLVLKIINLIKSKNSLIIIIMVICSLILLLLSSVYEEYDGVIFIALCLLYLLVSEICNFVKCLVGKYRSTQDYKIKCYKKIEQVATYREKGIITDEEYEMVRKQIMSKIMY